MQFESAGGTGQGFMKNRTSQFLSRLSVVLFLRPAVHGAVNPHLSISPTTGTLGVTSFTVSYSGFTPNGGITHYSTYPNGGVSTFNYTANGSGSYSTSFTLASQVGTYSAYAVDNTTGTHSNTITFTVNPSAAPPPTISFYNWTSTPVANVPFNGSVTGTGFDSSVQVWFCGTGTTNCFRHPAVGVILNNSNSLSLNNVNLTSAGSYQFYVQTSAGQSALSSAFTVSPPACGVSSPATMTSPASGSVLPGA